jgi:site-specific DNA-methyltransferase (adenine-specific)
MQKTPARNTLYYGDNLDYGDNLAILREHIADGSIGLIHLDPPFNSNASCNVLFRAPDGRQSPDRSRAARASTLPW